MKTEILGILLSDAATTHLKEQTDWNIVPAATTEEAIEKMQQFNFEVLVVPDGVLPGSDEVKLKKLLSLQEQLKTDKEIIRLRQNITQASAAQLQNGVSTVSDYLTQLHAEQQARLDQQRHLIQLAQAQVTFNLTNGNQQDLK